MEQPAIPPRQMTPADYEFAREEGNLKALAIGSAAYGGFQLVMVVAQLLIMNQWMKMMTPMLGSGRNAQFGQMFESIMQVAMTVSLVLMAINGLLALIAAKCIHDRKGWMLIMISAGFNCINVPIGTILGVFLFIVLCKPNVKRRFNREQPAFR